MDHGPDQTGLGYAELLRARGGLEGKRSLMEMHVLGLRLFHPLSLGTFFRKRARLYPTRVWMWMWMWMDMMPRDGWGRMDAVLAWRCAVCMVSLCRAFASRLRGERD